MPFKTFPLGIISNHGPVIISACDTLVQGLILKQEFNAPFLREEDVMKVKKNRKHSTKFYRVRWL